MNELDTITLNFSQDNIRILNISLGLIMFGVALNLTVRDFKEVIRSVKSPLVGVFSQFLVLPFLTFLLVLALRPQASVALGMMMVAACPGGNISNFMSSLAKGNTALSVSLTAVSTVLAIFMTPINLAFWGSLYGPTNEILEVVKLDAMEVFKTIVTILGIPTILGMLTRHYFSKFADRIDPVMRVLSIIIFGAFVVFAFAANFDLFLKYIHLIIFLVFLHNAIALTTGYQLGRLFRLPQPDRRTLAIETGIQNSGLGLLLIFSFFDGLGGMAMVAAWWGIWHIFAGLGVAFWWNSRRVFAGA